MRNCLIGLPIPEIRVFDQIGSTNDEAIRWTSEGAADSCLVVADTQTQGRGRFQRRWVTQPGAALAFSLIVRPTPAEMANLGLFSPLGALSIAQALETQYGLGPQIKWPNDVLLERQKVAGILVESVLVGEEVQSIVIGIGINVSSAAVPPPSDLLFPATSVEDAARRAVDRYELLGEVLRQTFQWRARLEPVTFTQAWSQRLAFQDEWVQIMEGGREPITGKVAGVDREGNLLLLGKNGETLTIVVGDLHLRPTG